MVTAGSYLRVNAFDGCDVEKALLPIVAALQVIDITDESHP